MKKTLNILLLVVFMLSVIGCRDSESKYCGTWEITGAEIDGAKFTIDELDALGGDSVYGISLILKSGGKACLMENGKSDLVDWSVTDNGLKIGMMDCKVVKDTILVEKGNAIVHFEKLSDSQEITRKTNTDYSITDGVASGDYIYRDLDDGTVEILKYTGSASSLAIDSEIDNKKVSKIGDNAFENCSSLKRISYLPDVVSIGNEAFKACDKLEELCILPVSVTSIGEFAFAECKNLKKIIIWGDINEFGDGAFKNCVNLKEILAPISKKIGNSAFEGCIKLNKVELYGVENIGERAFKDCKALKEIKIPPTIQIIGDYAFLNCTSLENVGNVDNTNLGVECFGNTPYWNKSNKGEQTYSEKTEWRKLLTEYEEWVDGYIALLKKYKENPSDISLLSDYTQMMTELSEWSEKTENMKVELSEASPAEVAEYSAELVRIAGKLAGAGV